MKPENTEDFNPLNFVRDAVIRLPMSDKKALLRWLMDYLIEDEPPSDVLSGDILVKDIIQVVKRNKAGISASELSKEMDHADIPQSLLGPLLRDLVKGKKLRKTGQRRGTKYLPLAAKSKTPPKKPKAKAKAKKKAPSANK